MSVVPTLSAVSQRKRLACVLIAASLCMAIAACGNDDKPADTASTASSSADSPTDNANAPAATQDGAQAAAPAAVTIQTPALPASGDDATLSAAASAPLATPVIHTAD